MMVALVTVPATPAKLLRLGATFELLPLSNGLSVSAAVSARPGVMVRPGCRLAAARRAATRVLIGSLGRNSVEDVSPCTGCTNCQV